MTSDDLKKIEVRKNFPKDAAPGFNMGMGDEELPNDQVYGKPRIVNRTKNGTGISRKVAESIFKARGVKYDTVFCDARWWCAAVYE